MKNRYLTVFMLLSLLATLAGNASAGAPPLPEPKALVYVELTSTDDQDRFTSTGLPIYMVMDGGLLTAANASSLQSLQQAGLSFQVLEAIERSGSYYLAESRSSQLLPDYTLYGQVLLETQSQVLLQMAESQVEAITQAGVEIRRVTLTPKPLPQVQRQPSVPEVIQPDPLIQGMINQVTTSDIYLYDRQLAGEIPVLVDDQWYNIMTRYTYSGTPIQKTTHFVGQQLAAAGLQVEYHVWNNTTNPNVIGEYTGWTNPEDIYIIGAHIDDVSGTPGADDNASGSVATLIAADIFSQYYWGCTLRFALWTGEEQGMLGSQRYALRAYQRGEDILGYLNLDMIAWNTAFSAPYINLIYSNSLPPTYDLALLFNDVIEAYNLNLLTRLGTGITGSDHSSFWDYGYTSILAIEDDIGYDFNPYYHGPGDTPTHTDSSYFTNFVKASVSTFAHMSDCLLPTGILSGYVTDTDTGLPLYNATLTAVQGNNEAHTITDQAGYYTMTLPAGAYSVTASLDGFVDQTKNTTILVGQGSFLDFSLQPACSPVTQAYFTWQPLDPVSGEPVTFTASSDGSSPISYAWYFGDGTSGEGLSITHTYTESGAYTTVFTATNACGEAVSEHNLTVLPACLPVTGLDFAWQPLEPFNRQPITFIATASGTQPITFQWNFGGGIIGTEKTVIHAYSQPGDYDIALSAANACSAPPQVNKTIIILQLPWKNYLPVVGWN